MTDIVREILNRARRRIAEAYGLPAEVEALLGQVEQEIKAELNGGRFYVSAPPCDKAGTVAEKVVQDYAKSVSVDDITARHGISRATLYRYLKRR